MFCVCDFETRSYVDLKKVSAWNYSKHPTTEILCFYVWDSVSKSIHRWDCNSSVPDWFLYLYENNMLWVAHNAFFEIAIWRHVLSKNFVEIPCPPLENWFDSQSLVLNWAMPKSLENAAKVLGHEQKDKDGHNLMIKMSSPVKKKGFYRYHWTEADFCRLGNYCEQDVKTALSIVRELGPLQDCEKPIYHLDKKINFYGFKIDVEFAAAAKQMAQNLNEQACAELNLITNGKITSPGQHLRFKKIAMEYDLKMQSTDKNAILDALKQPNLHPTLKRIFEIRRDIGRSSVAKYQKALNLVDRDTHRIYNSLVYHKAGPGKWAGQGFQPQNLPRGTIKEFKNPKNVESCIRSIKDDDLEAVKKWGNPMDVLSSLCRSTIIADAGKKFVTADFSGVESRGVLWLAGEDDAVEMLRRGGDLYIEMAAEILNKPASEVSKTERNELGKPTILGLGYGMGSRRFDAENDVGPLLAEKAVSTYKTKFPNVPIMWRAFERHFKDCTLTKKEQISRYKNIRFRMKTDRVLVIALPSGREMKYWDPKIDSDGNLTYWTVGANGKWINVHTWGGKLTENITTGMCSDMLRYSMLSLSRLPGWDIVLTVHDEITSETPDKPEYNAKRMIEIMLGQESWAKSFPLAAEGGEGYRFKK